MYTKLKELSPQEWLKMGNGVYTLSHLQATFMIKGLLGGELAPYNDYLFNKYKNIKKAVAIRDKEIEKERKEKKSWSDKNQTKFKSAAYSQQDHGVKYCY